MISDQKLASNFFVEFCRLTREKLRQSKGKIENRERITELAGLNSLEEAEAWFRIGAACEYKAPEYSELAIVDMSSTKRARNKQKKYAGTKNQF